jgi:hypothetical protein
MNHLILSCLAGAVSWSVALVTGTTRPTTHGGDNSYQCDLNVTQVVNYRWKVQGKGVHAIN